MGGMSITSTTPSASLYHSLYVTGNIYVLPPRWERQADEVWRLFGGTHLFPAQLVGDTDQNRYRHSDRTTRGGHVPWHTCTGTRAYLGSCLAAHPSTP